MIVNLAGLAPNVPLATEDNTGPGLGRSREPEVLLRLGGEAQEQEAALSTAGLLSSPPPNPHAR